MKDKTHTNALQQQLVVTIAHRNKKVKVSDVRGQELISIDRICYMQSDNSSTDLFFEDKSKITSTRSIKSFEKELQHDGFFRVHQRKLVNMNKIKRLNRGEYGTLVLENGEELDIARNRRKNFIAAYDRWNNAGHVYSSVEAFIEPILLKHISTVLQKLFSRGLMHVQNPQDSSPG